MSEGDNPAPGLFRSCSVQTHCCGESQFYDWRSDGSPRSDYVHHRSRRDCGHERIQSQPSESEASSHDKEIHALHSSKN